VVAGFTVTALVALAATLPSASTSRVTSRKPRAHVHRAQPRGDRHFGRRSDGVGLGINAAAAIIHHVEMGGRGDDQADRAIKPPEQRSRR
jgi:hypothetical protein